MWLSIGWLRGQESGPTRAGRPFQNTSRGRRIRIRGPPNGKHHEYLLLPKCDRTEQSVIFYLSPVGDAGSEVERIRIPAVMAVAKLQSPQARHCDWIAVPV